MSMIEPLNSVEVLSPPTVRVLAETWTVPVPDRLPMVSDAVRVRVPPARDTALKSPMALPPLAVRAPVPICVAPE